MHVEFSARALAGIEIFYLFANGNRRSSILIEWRDLKWGLRFFTKSDASLVILKWTLILFTNSDPGIVILKWALIRWRSQVPLPPQ